MKPLITVMIMLGILPWARENNVAITEFMNDPVSLSDATGEWGELFNYGPATVDLGAWTLADEDTDSVSIPAGTTIQSDDFLILTTDKTAFEAEWLGGVANATVFNVDVASLDNSDDELILLDATGAGRVAAGLWG